MNNTELLIYQASGGGKIKLDVPPDPSLAYSLLKEIVQDKCKKMRNSL
ncbi:MAG: hypothetical protein NT163_04925 [Chlorobiales bacterium]|nr:hypothetical protein [Chlorobiales bacterium]